MINALDAIIGGFFVLAGVIFANSLNNRRLRNEDQKKIQNFRSALLIEIKTYYTLYIENIRTALGNTPDGSPFLYYYPVTQENYFTVYDNNANMIGDLSDTYERELIVEVYARTRALIDTYRFNNEMIKKYDLFSENLENTNNIINRKNIKQNLIDYAQLIKNADAMLADCTERLIDKLSTNSHSEI